MIPELPIIIAYIGMGAAAVAIAVVAANSPCASFSRSGTRSAKKIFDDIALQIWDRNDRPAYLHAPLFYHTWKMAQSDSFQLSNV
jgi:hypothetical protein